MILVTTRVDVAGGAVRRSPVRIQPTALVRPILPLFMRLNAGRNRYLLGNLKRALEAGTT